MFEHSPIDELASAGDWVTEIASKVRDLLREQGPAARARWQTMVKEWQARRVKTDLYPPGSLPQAMSEAASPPESPLRGPYSLTVAALTPCEKYAALAAIHDAVYADAEPLDPWAGQDTLEAAGYWGMVAEVPQLRGAPSPEDGREWHDGYAHVLKDVGADLKQALAHESDSLGGTGSPHGQHAADARTESDPPAPHMPSDWFRTVYGIPEARLRAARKRGSLSAQNVGTPERPRYRYSVHGAANLWPDEGIEPPR